MRNRIRPLVLASLLIITMYLSACATDEFIIDENGVLIEYIGSGNDVIIPDSVTKIGDQAFKERFELTSVIIPNSVTAIGESAFARCSELTNISIPCGVTVIGDHAFNWCVRLTSISIPHSVTEIGRNAFAGCFDLTIHGIADTYVETFANEMSIKFVAETPTSSLDTASGWAKAEITCAIAKGFVPEDIQGSYTSEITRQEFCRLAVRFVEYALGKDIDDILSERRLSRNHNAFTDTTDPYILAAFTLGITNGTRAPTDTIPGLFTPEGRFTRQEAATMLIRVCGLIGMDISHPPASDFVDMSEAYSWAHNGINFVHANGIMSGTSATTPTFSPKGTYTRQESIVTFDRIR